jgi:molybdopterin-synthase adenylyltransferase
MTDEQLQRYSRHILLDAIGIEGQQRLLGAHAVVVGAGGLGCSAALFLASAGVGRLTVVDDDRVELTNLQRQIAHTMERLGQPKAESIRTAIAQINPDPQVRALCQRADLPMLTELAHKADVLLDCTDNYATRHAINRACVQTRTPLVSGSATGWDGQLAVFDARNGQSPCYACLFPPEQEAPQVHCATMGVFAPLVGIIGSMQASEALKLLGKAGAPAIGQLLMVQADRMGWESIRTPRDPLCVVCGSAHAADHSTG